MQCWLQPPQSNADVLVSTQRFRHSVKPAAHPQVPELHAKPAGHALPQAPQFCGSEVVSRQLFPHIVVGGGHAHAMGGDEPVRLHVVPEEQTFPQEPQLLLSDSKFTHALPQSVVPEMHGDLHMPPIQR
jgi:hypothetical protein